MTSPVSSVARRRAAGFLVRTGLPVAFLVALAVAPPAPAAAQDPAVEAARAAASRFAPALVQHPQVADALAWIEANFEAQVEEWILITEIPAPSEQEWERGAYVAEQMRALGLQVSIDSIGNVMGVRPGRGGGPTLVFAAHIDTVHPMDVDVTVRRDGDILRAPGIFDNSASVANMLAVARAMDHAGIETAGDVIFIGTAQEELGLRGMSYWLDRNPGRADMLVALDGGLGSISYGALGIYWTRYHFLGDGAHTNQSAGRPHPVRALADAVDRIYQLRIPEGQGGAVYNVGMLDGGSIFNAIPERVSFTMDLRSVNPVLLDSLHAEIEARVEAAAEAHGVRWEAEPVNRMQAGGTEDQLADRREHPLVVTAEGIYGFLELGNRTVASGSTDANAGVVRGIPSISVGRSRGGDQHTLSEWSDVPSALPATQAVLLLAVSLAELAGGAPVP
jgi:tripeptide aminopeptidase